jgi:hypothetical protein
LARLEKVDILEGSVFKLEKSGRLNSGALPNQTTHIDRQDDGPYLRIKA